MAGLNALSLLETTNGNGRNFGETHYTMVCYIGRVVGKHQEQQVSSANLA